MVELDQDETAPTSAANMSSKKKELLSTAMKRTSEWFELILLFLYPLVFVCINFLVCFLETCVINGNGTMNFFRIFSQEIPSDVTVLAGGASFSLHKVGFLNLDSSFSVQSIITLARNFFRN